jgi:membrane protein DedA with SNARE-associated domain
VTQDAHHVTVIAAICALTTATCVGYYVGRRAGRARPNWKKRTSRTALGKQVISLVATIAARRIQQGLRREGTFSDRWGTRLIVPLAFLRGSVVRMRSY